jgi:hypothetical protein
MKGSFTFKPPAAKGALSRMLDIGNPPTGANTAQASPRKGPTTRGNMKPLRLFDEESEGGPDFQKDPEKMRKFLGIVEEVESSEAFKKAHSKLDDIALEELRQAVDFKQAATALQYLAVNKDLDQVLAEFRQFVAQKLVEQKSTEKEPALLDVPSAVVDVQGTPPSESELVASIVANLNDILCRACQPALTFIGKVAVKLRENDVRNLLVWNDNPKATMDDRLKFVKAAPTIGEFIEANRELGSEFLTSYLETQLSKEYITSPALPARGGEGERKRLKLVDAQLQTPFNLDIYEKQYDQTNRLRFIEEQRLKVRALLHDMHVLGNNPTPQSAAKMEELRQTEALLTGLIALSISEVELKFAPAWAFESLSNSIFRHIWSTTSLAAVEAAAQAVRRIEGCSSFTIKELISSEQVSDQFAFLVSASYLNSGDGIPQAQSRGGRGGNRQSTYLNVLRMREMLASKIYTCNIWFESVRKRPNPLVAQFKEQVAMVLATIQDEQEKRNRVAKFAKLEASLPKWELIYSGY